MTTNHPDHPRRELPKTLAGLNTDFDADDDQDFDDKDLDEDEGDCAFCLGREAAHRGESEDANPYPKTDARPGSTEWFDTDYGLWLAGHGIGAQKNPDLS